jgi:hypothetical protein
MGFVFLPGYGVNGLSFIDFPLMELRTSPEEAVVAVFLTLVTFGSLYTFAEGKNLFSVPDSVIFRRCKAKASWIHEAACSSRFWISSTAAAAGAGYNSLRKGAQIWAGRTSSDENLGTSMCILSLATGLVGQEESS